MTQTRPRAHRTAGFTLVELLAVLAVIAMAATVVVLSLPDGAPRARDQARTFAARAQLAAEEAVLSGAPVGVRLTEEGYGFVRYQQGRWSSLDGLDMFADAPWAPGTLVSLRRDGVEISLGEDADGPAQASGVPLVRFGATGDATPFLIILDQGDEAFVVEGDAGGGISVRREGEDA